MRAKSLYLHLLALAAVSPAAANDLYFNGANRDFFTSSEPTAFSYSSPDHTLQLRLGAGVTFINANEYVFNGDRTLSQLIWETKAPVLRGSVDLELGHGFSVNAGGSVAGYGLSYMEDYDWLVSATSFDQWTHQSIHPDTRLDHYFSGEAALGYELANSGDAKVRLLTGFKYTDVQWSAYGGSYIYSENGFRDTVGNFADGEPGITYRQKLPEVFIGVDGDQTYGNLRVGGLLRGGLTVFGSAIDNHWMRDRLFEDQFRVAPTFTAGLDVNYALGPMAEIFLAGRYDRAFLMRGSTKVFNTNTGALVASGDDTGGADLGSLEITTGLKGRF